MLNNDLLALRKRQAKQRETSTLIRVSRNFHALIKSNAEKQHITICEYLTKLVEKENIRNDK